jgi:hypothetical protein
MAWRCVRRRRFGILKHVRSGDGNTEAVRMGAINGSKQSKESKELVYYKSNYVPKQEEIEGEVDNCTTLQRTNKGEQGNVVGDVWSRT